MYFVHIVRLFTNYTIFHELCDRMRFEANYAKSHHRIISEALYSSLMQTLEGVWENSKALCKPKPHTKLLSSPKLPLVFATGYVNMVHILYFLTLHVKYYYSLAIPFIQLHWPIENKYIYACIQVVSYKSTLLGTS